MRRLLFTAAAAAPLALLAAPPALADTTINSTSTPVKTSTANNGQPDNLTIGSGATASGSPTAVTLDSSNSVTNAGTISIKDVDGSTGVLILGGHTGNFTNTGTINISESYTATDTNGDGVLDGVYAKGAGRYGVRLTGSSPLVGTINNASGSSITVQGNSSFGMSLEAMVQGDVLQAGTISVIGNSSTGFSETGGVSGKVQITSAVSATGGGGSAAVNIGGDVGGALTVYGGLSSTGYRTTTRSVDPTVNAKLLPEDLQLSGPALTVGANVGSGLLIGSPPAGTSSTDTTTDADGDGVVDSSQGIGSVTTFGSAPALVVGASGRAITLGILSAAKNPYGLILEGNVAGNGVFDTFSANAVQIGGQTGGQVTINGGVSITDTSTISAQAYQASATAIHFGSNVTTPLLQNAGTIAALSTETSATTAFSTTALQIEQGSSLQTLKNTGIINSVFTGDLGSAYGVVDKSGSITSVTNLGTINASITPATPTDAVTGATVALDLSASKLAITLTQAANPNPVTTPTASTTATITSPTTLSPTSPSITGDIRLGSGNNKVEFDAGTVTGALSLGSGQSSLTINGGAYTGQLTSGGTMTSLTVNKGSLADTSTSQINTNSLTVGAAGQLVVAVDPANRTATFFKVTGQATIASGGTLGVKLVSLLPSAQHYTIIQAGSLSTPGATAGFSADTPYLFVAGVTANPAAGTVTLDLQRRTAAQANLNRAETAAWDPVYNNLSLDPGVERAFLSQTTEAGYRSMLDQVLPNYSGSVFRALSWASEEQGVAAGEPPLGQEQSGPTRAWTQEIVLSETKNADQAAGYHILGVGAVAGLESVSPKGDALGMKIGFTTANIKDPSLPSDNLLGVSEINGGVYWRGAVGPLRADAQLGAGFIWANDRREFLFSDSSGVVHRTARANWSGYSLSGRLGLQYTATMGSFFIQPRVHADYFRLHESGYTETGGGNGFDMTVNGRNGDLLSVTGSVMAGMTFGSTGFRWRPQVEVGYRSVLSGSAGATTAEFVGGSDPFSLASESLSRGSAIGRLGLRVYSDYVDLLLDAGGEFNSTYTDLDIHLTARTVF